MTDLRLLNSGLRKARLKYEAELRAAVQEGSILLAESEGIVEPDAITAAGVPGDESHLTPVERVAANISRVVRRGQKAVSLAAARGIATTRAQEWYERHVDRLDQQATRAGQEGARTILGWVKGKQITKISKDGRDAYSLARSVESVGAGGQPSVSANGQPTGAAPRTVMDDDEFRAMILDEGAAEPRYQWEHGTPPKPFGPHEELDGVTWTAEDELEVLANPNDFPRAASYFPGDHDGCTCRYDIEFVRIA